MNPKGREVLECASTLALGLGQSGRVESARGLAHCSKTLARGRWFMALAPAEIRQAIVHFVHTELLLKLESATTEHQ